MCDSEPIDEIRRARQRWEAEAARAEATRGDEPRQHDPDLTVRAVYTPAEVADQDVDYLRDLGLPGHYPFTRGIRCIERVIGAPHRRASGAPGEHQQEAAAADHTVTRSGETGSLAGGASEADGA